MVEVPLQFARVDVERDRGVREESRAVARSAAGTHPRFGLCGTPIRQIQVGIVATRDPGLGAYSEHVWEAAPRVATEFASLGNRVELPQQLPGPCVIRADETLFVLIV